MEIVKTSDSQPSLSDLLAGHDHHAALVDGDRMFTRLQLRQAGQRAALHLHRIGLRRGDALAIWLPNGVAWLQLLIAASWLGVLVVPISTRYKKDEVRHLLTISKARWLVSPRHFLKTDHAAIGQQLREEVPTLENCWALEHPCDLLPIESDAEAGVSAHVLNGQADDLLCCFSTSGTTGQPKLATHAHGSMVRHAECVKKGLDVQPGDAMLCALPFYGVFGFMTLLASLAGGATAVLMPVFEPAMAAEIMRTHGITHAVGSDSMFAPMLELPSFKPPRLRRIVQADFVGLSLSVAQQCDRLGVQSSGTYGSSEVYSLMTFQDWHADVAQRALAGGKPVDPAIEFRIVDSETHAVVSQGEPGELQIRGPNVLAGYLNQPQATAKAMTEDGWFRTGDLACSDAHGFTYLARMGDSLRLRGYLVNPAEIEQCLMQHPDVSGCQVVGVRQPGQGDVAIAYVTADSKQPDESALIQFCKEHLANYKVPQRVVVIDEFPVINGPNGGKIQKRVLREWAQKMMEQSA
jgi:fatty-acyl-CoA synthase